MISYWARLLTGKETKLSYLSYKILYNLFIDENLDFSWIKHVKHIFDKYESFVSLPVNSLAQYDIILNFTSISIGNDKVREL
jgi:hypothetical protein